MILYFILLSLSCIFDSDLLWIIFLMHCLVETIKILYKDFREERSVSNINNSIINLRG